MINEILKYMHWLGQFQIQVHIHSLLYIPLGYQSFDMWNTVFVCDIIHYSFGIEFWRN